MILSPHNQKGELNSDVEKCTKLFSEFQKTRIIHQSAIRQNIDLFLIDGFNRKNAIQSHAFPFSFAQYAPSLTMLSLFYKLTGAFWSPHGRHCSFEGWLSPEVLALYLVLAFLNVPYIKILYSYMAFLRVRIMNTNVRIMNISSSFDKISHAYRLSRHSMLYSIKTNNRNCEVSKCLAILFSPFIICSA